MEKGQNHEFKIHFSFQGIEYSAIMTMNQKEDHDEYHIIPNDDMLIKEYGSKTIDYYYNQKDPLRTLHQDSDYCKALVKGVQEFLESKHS